MPILTDVQNCASKILHKLHCVRHDQIHWMINREYPNVDPEKVMRQVCHITRVRNDGQHYIWPGCVLSPERIAAVDIMRQLSGNIVPIYDTARAPCNLVFFIVQRDRMQSFRIYTPKEGSEEECQVIIENQREPKGYAAVIYISNEKQIPLLKISRPHVFVISDDSGGYTFRDARL